MNIFFYEKKHTNDQEVYAEMLSITNHWENIEVTMIYYLTGIRISPLLKKRKTDVVFIFKDVWRN